MVISPLTKNGMRLQFRIERKEVLCKYKNLFDKMKRLNDTVFPLIFQNYLCRIWHRVWKLEV